MHKLILGLALLVAACGSDSGTCESASAKLCARACECGAPKCVFGDGMGASVSFDNRSDCEAFLNLGCGGSGADGVDFAACEADTEAAACVGSGSNMAFASPASCDNGN